MKYMRLLIALLIIPIMVSGCSSKQDIKILKWTNTSGNSISVQIEESDDEYKMIGACPRIRI